jgi:carbonic anhydrase
MTRRSLLSLISGSAISGSALAANDAGHRRPADSSPDAALQRLNTGNLRFRNGRPGHPHSSRSWAVRQSQLGQHPFAIILCCADSRVAPEIIFDQGLGNLFVVRVAGNVAQDDEIGSIEYAAAHFQVPLCVVLGHSDCGAIRAVLDHEALPPEAEHLVAPIVPAVETTRGRFPLASGRLLIEESVKSNVLTSCKAIGRPDTALGRLIADGHFRVEGAVYDLVSGRVSWLKSS